MPLVKVLVVLALVAIIFSLGSAVIYMMRDRGDSKRMVKALTWRIGLSVALFILLIIAWAMGFIQPHGLYPVQ